MIHTVAECKDLRRRLQVRAKEGRLNEVMEEIHDLRRAGEIKNNFSLRRLFEHTVENGYEVLGAMESRHRQGGGVVMEAGDAVSTANFSNIIGQIAYADVLQNFDSPSFIGGELMTEIPATTQQQEIVPGITMIGDKASQVGEGETYPVVQIGEQWITLPSIVKDGFVMNITEEAIFEDKTGQLLQNFNMAAESMAITHEKQRLRTALGTDSSYSRNGGPVQATYGNTHTQGTFDNLIGSNPLIDLVALSTSKNAFLDIVDPNTGEPVDLGGEITLVVPDPLQWQAYMILNATEVRYGASAATPTFQTIGGNPINSGGRSYRVLSNQYVSSIVGDDTTWFAGNFKKAFVERVIYRTEVIVQDRTSDMSFDRDIVSRVKVRRKTKPAAKEPRFVQKNTSGA